MTRKEAIDYLEISMTIDDSRYHNEVLKFIIKELEQEPCEDCISRQDAIDAVRKSYENNEMLDGYEYRLRDLPSAQAEQRWIPVSEWLPLLRYSCNVSDDVLITNGHEVYMGYLVAKDGKFFWHYYSSAFEVGIKDKDNDAIAWMPLPEPYRAESDDKE